MADCDDCVVLVCASQPFVSLPDFGSLSLSPALLLFAASLAMASSSALVSSLLGFHDGSACLSRCAGLCTCLEWHASP